MKKIQLIVVVSTFVLYSNSHAQLLRGYGLKLGAVAADQNWKYTSIPALSTDNRWDFTAAVFVELLDHPFLSAIIEVQYTRKGMSESIPITTEAQPDGTGEFITKKPRVDYISIPLLAKVRFSTPEFSPYLIAGPRFDFLVSKKGDTYEVVIDKFETTEFGATVGVGIDFASLLPVNLLAEFRYNPSFNDAFNNNFLSVRNRSLDFLLGVRL
jgi:opacity protein-like surface antigen